MRPEDAIRELAAEFAETEEEEAALAEGALRRLAWRKRRSDAK